MEGRFIRIIILFLIKMKKLLPDTNVYGLLVADPERRELHEKIHHSSLLLFGFSIIRKELRDTPKHIRFLDKNLRIDLLSVYDDLIKKSYSLEEEMEQLAENYFTTYRSFGGSIAKAKIFPDFLIVACATLKQMDIVVSEDVHSLLTENALKAYQLINTIKKLTSPSFIRYREFKELVKKSA